MEVAHCKAVALVGLCMLLPIKRSHFAVVRRDFRGACEHATGAWPGGEKRETKRPVILKARKIGD